MSSSDDRNRGRPLGVPTRTDIDSAADAAADKDRIIQLSGRLRRSAKERGLRNFPADEPGPRDPSPDIAPAASALPDLGITHLPGGDSLSSVPLRSDDEVPFHAPVPVGERRDHRRDDVRPPQKSVENEPDSGPADQAAPAVVAVADGGTALPDESEIVEQWRASIEQRKQAEANRDPFGGAGTGSAADADEERSRKPSRLTQMVDYTIYAAVFIAAITAFLMSADRGTGERSASVAGGGFALAPDDAGSAVPGLSSALPAETPGVALSDAGPRMSRFSEAQRADLLGAAAAEPEDAGAGIGPLAAQPAVSAALPLPSPDGTASRPDVELPELATLNGGADDGASPILPYSGAAETVVPEGANRSLAMAPGPSASPSAGGQRTRDEIPGGEPGSAVVGALPSFSAAEQRGASAGADAALGEGDPEARPSTADMRDTISDKNWVQIRPGLFVPFLQAREGFLATRGAGVGDLAAVEAVRLSAVGVARMQLPDPRNLARDEALLALEGQSIKNIKRVLASAGFPSDSEGPEIDPSTRSALARWQASVDLPVTGYFDGRTVDALAALPDPDVDAEPKAAAAKPTVRRRAARTAPAESPIPPRAAEVAPPAPASGCQRTASGALVPGQSIGCDVQGLFSEFSEESLTPERKKKIDEIVNEAGAER